MIFDNRQKKRVREPVSLHWLDSVIACSIGFGGVKKSRQVFRIKTMHSFNKTKVWHKNYSTIKFERV